MRYLRKQVLNDRAPYDQRLQVDINNNILMSSPAAFQIPAGTTAQRPIVGNKYSASSSSDLSGMIRYNTDTSQLEGYQSGKWRSFQFKESNQITQQNLGAGDGTTVYFGPLNAAYDPTNISSDVTSYGGQNMLVIVENVLQLSTTNYTVVQNPAESVESYSGSNAVATSIGATTINFNTALLGAYASSNGTTATLNLVQSTTNTQVAFAIGASITTTGYTPTGLNGTYTVTGSSVSAFSNTTGFISGNTLSLTGTTTGSPAVGGNISGTGVTYGTYISSANSASFTATFNTTISSVVIAGTSGQFTCTAPSLTLMVGQLVTISGTYGGGGSISSYTNPTTYKISVTNGTTSFTLTALDGTALTTTAGTPTGLTYTLNVLSVSAISSGTISVGMVITGTSVTAGTYITAIGTGSGGIGTYMVNQSVTGTPTTGTSYTVNNPQTVSSTAITGLVSTVSFANTTNATATVVGNVKGSNAIYIDSDINGAIVTGSASLQTGTLSTVVITGTGGQFSCTSTTLVTGQAVVISGAFGGTGSISGYTNSITYYIIATNGSTTFTLSSSFSGSAITTTPGTPTGLTYTIPTTVTAFTSDPVTDALISVTISRPTITSIIAVNTSITITENANVGSGYYLMFSSPVPLGKPVTVLHGFDR